MTDTTFLILIRRFVAREAISQSNGVLTVVVVLEVVKMTMVVVAFAKKYCATMLAPNIDH